MGRNDRGEGIPGMMVALLLLGILGVSVGRIQLTLVDSTIDRLVFEQLGDVVTQVLEPATYQDCTDPNADCGPDRWADFRQVTTDDGNGNRVPVSPDTYRNSFGAKLEATGSSNNWILRLDARRYVLEIDDDEKPAPDCLVAADCLALLPDWLMFPTRTVTIKDSTGVTVAGQQVTSIRR